MVLKDFKTKPKTFEMYYILSVVLIKQSFYRPVLNSYLIYSLVSGGFSPRLVPTPKSSVPHPAILPTGVKQEPGDSSQPG